MKILWVLAFLLTALSTVQAQERDDPDGGRIREDAVIRLGTARWRHGGVVFVVAFSPDGTRALSTGRDGTAVVWDVATGRREATLTGYPGWVECAAWTPDGASVLTGGGGSPNNLTCRAVPAGRVTPFNGHKDAVIAAAIRMDGKMALTGSVDRTIGVWDMQSGKQTLSLEGHEGWITSVAFTPDGTHALSGSRDQTAILWNLETGRRFRTFVGHMGRVLSVAVSPDGKLAATAGTDRVGILWDLGTGRRLRTFEGHAGDIHCVRFTPDGKRLLTGSADRTLALWEVDTGKRLRVFEGHSDRVHSVSISPDGKRALSGSRDSTIGLWDLETGALLNGDPGHRGSVCAVALSPDGSSVLTASDDRTLALWSASTGKLLLSFRGHEDRVFAAAFTPDGRLAVSGSRDTTLRVWDVSTGASLRTLEGHKDEIRSVSVSHDGRLAASASWDGTLGLWDLETGKRIRTFEGHEAVVRTVAFSPDSRTLLSGSMDRSLGLWSVADGKRLRSLHGHQDGVWSAAFSPDGRWIVSGGQDRATALWTLPDGAPTLLNGLDAAGQVRCVAVSPDGGQIAVGGDGRVLLLWDVKTHRLLSQLTGHRGPINAVAFSMGGRFVISGSEDTTALVWQPALTAAKRASDWAAAWRAQGEEKRRADLQALVENLAALSWQSFCEVREKSILAGDEAVHVLREAFPPEPALAPLTEDRKTELLQLLDHDEVDVRKKAREELRQHGSSISPWLDRQLKENATLSAEVRSALLDLRRAAGAAIFAPSDLSRTRAMLVLVEMPAREAVIRALRDYAEGPETSYAATLARRALRRMEVR